MTKRFGVVGDVHLAWDAQDVAQIDAQGYDAVIFVGDLAGYVDHGLAVARQIATLRTPAFFMPGNHDGVHLMHLAAEVLGKPALARPFEAGQSARCEALRQALHPVTMCGYSLHDVAGLTLVAGRPHSIGGDRVAFAALLRQWFGVDSFASSAALLKRRVEQARHDDLVFFAHNGPSGLGARRHDIWGCDFRKAEGDFGDVDLRAAIEHAQSIGKRVVAVVGGHMHHRLKGGGERTWCVQRDGITYVNAARVPRIVRGVRHHVRLTIDAGQAEAEAIAL